MGIFLPLNERQQISRLFAFLLEGERLAMDCAKQQSQFFTDKPSKRFLTNQAKQEYFHCQVFKSGIGILSPRGVKNIPGEHEFKEYRKLLEEALLRGDQAESLLGMQIILEGLGDVAINHINKGFTHRDIGSMCRRVRHMILGQEDAHHTFGLRRFQNSFDDQEIPDYLIKRSQDYLQLVIPLIQSVSELFHYFDESSDQYLDEFYHELPNWITVAQS